MIVRNLHAWAGADFSFRPGEFIELDEDIAVARIEAGLCDLPPESPAPSKMPTVEPPAAEVEPPAAEEATDEGKKKKKKE